MKFLIGACLCLIGAFLGLYVSIWVCFIGGIVDVIGQLKAQDLDAMVVALGIAKVVFSGIAGWISFILLFIPGLALIQDS